MDRPDDEPVTWREERDPHYPMAFRWRCRAFVFEFYNTFMGEWYERDSPAYKSFVGPQYVTNPTPEREALWRDLFLNP